MHIQTFPNYDVTDFLFCADTEAVNIQYNLLF